ncbi:MAG: hypothetical protein C1941_03625 [Prosthecochloris sp.]|nr:hypothetical protein [Prosthecochloris sp.]
MLTEIAEKVIDEWKIRNSDERKQVLEAVLWESHSAPESGEWVQGILKIKSKHRENKRRKGHK